MNVTAASRNLVAELVDYVRRRGCVRGDRLPSIRELADALHIGRNAVRDAVLQAQSMGLVKIEPRLGVFVQDPDAAPNGHGPVPVIEKALARGEYNIFHVMEARLLVELELVGKAARAGCPEELLPLRQAMEAVLGDDEDRAAYIEADLAFHLEIARLAGNPVLVAFLRTLLGLLRPFKQSVLLSAENRERSDREHVELYRTILEGQPEPAQAIMREHLAQGFTLLREHLRTLPKTPGDGSGRTDRLSLQKRRKPS